MLALTFFKFLVAILCKLCHDIPVECVAEDKPIEKNESDIPGVEGGVLEVVGGIKLCRSGWKQGALSASIINED